MRYHVELTVESPLGQGDLLALVRERIWMGGLGPSVEAVSVEPQSVADEIRAALGRATERIETAIVRIERRNREDRQRNPLALGSDSGARVEGGGDGA